jgi:ubiquitin-protein ligase
VANVIGLISLLDHEQLDNPKNAEVIKHLIASSHELDQTIQHIVKKTNDINVSAN